MKRLLFAILIATVALAAVAQEKPKQGGAPEPDAQMKATMEAYAKAAEPGAMHTFLASLAGTWAVESKAWMGPGEPHTSKATAVCTMIFGGRYLVEEFKGEFAGTPFEGRGITGFDNTAKQFQSVWIDSMSTGLGVGTGSLDASGKVLTSTMTYMDPKTGKEGRMKAVLRIVDEKTHIFEMFEVGPDGKESKSMEMTYRKV